MQQLSAGIDMSGQVSDLPRQFQSDEAFPVGAALALVFWKRALALRRKRCCDEEARVVLVPAFQRPRASPGRYLVT